MSCKNKKQAKIRTIFKTIGGISKNKMAIWDNF